MVDGTATPPGTPGRSRGWLVVGAAVAVIAIAGGAVILAGRDRSGAPHLSVAPKQSTTAEQQSAQPADPVGLVVRDGDTVEASGQVIAAPGKPVIFCPMLPSDAVGHLPGHEPAPQCPPRLAATVIGVRLADLAAPATIQGVRTGTATLRGTWHASTLTVTAQRPPAVEPTPTVDLPALPASCAAPPGGWQRGSGNDTGQAPDPYLAEHPDWFGQPWVVYPEGDPAGPTDAPGYTDKPSVLVIPAVAGDLDRIRADLTARYHGNLCVAPAPAGMRSQRQADAIRARYQPLFDTPTARMYEGSSDLNGLLSMKIAWLDEDFYNRLRDLGLSDVDVQPWLRPVHP